jgi:hypothetical protein
VPHQLKDWLSRRVHEVGDAACHLVPGRRPVHRHQLLLVAEDQRRRPSEWLQCPAGVQGQDRSYLLISKFNLYYSLLSTSLLPISKLINAYYVFFSQ